MATAIQEGDITSTTSGEILQYETDATENDASEIEEEPMKRRRGAALTYTHLGKFETKTEAIAAMEGKWTIINRLRMRSQDRFLAVVEDNIVRFWSLERDPTAVNARIFATVPELALCDWTKAYQWLQRKQPIVVIKLQELKLYYIGSSKNPDINKRTVDAWMTTHLDCAWDNFDALTRHEESMYCIVPNEEDFRRGKCSCAWYSKNYVC